MSRVCQVCNNSQRLDIDRELVQGKIISKLALEYKVPAHSLRYHQEHHLSRQLVQCRERKDILENILNLERLERAMVKVESILDRNYESGQDMIALAANRELRGVFETLARISDALLEVKRLEFEQTQAEKKIDVSDFTKEELQLALKLGIKMNGDMVDLLAPSGEALCFDNVVNTESEEAPEFQDRNFNPKVSISPIPRVPPPPPTFKTAPKTVSNADYADEPAEPGESPGPEQEPTKTLPPAPCQVIPGGSKARIRINRHLLGKKIYEGQGER